MTFMINIKFLNEAHLGIYSFFDCNKGHHNNLFLFDVTSNKKVPYKIITIRAIALAREIMPVMGHLRGLFLRKRPVICATYAYFIHVIFHDILKAYFMTTMSLYSICCLADTI